MRINSRNSLMVKNMVYRILIFFLHCLYLDDKMSNPKYFVFEVTNKCNLACAWCWAGSHMSSKELSTNEILDGLEKLRKVGCESINITGGEPTVRNDLSNIVNCAVMLGMKSILTTNCILLLEKYRDLLHKVECLSISLDSSIESVNNKMRCLGNGKPSNQYKSVMGVLEYYRKETPSRLKLNTTVERRNIFPPESIANIGHLAACDVWRIAPAKKEGIAKKNWERTAITKSEFESLIKEIKRRRAHGEYNAIKRIYIREFEDEKTLYPLLIIRSDGSIYVPGEIVFETGINISDEDFVPKYNEFLQRHQDLGKRNEELFLGSYS